MPFSGLCQATLLVKRRIVSSNNVRMILSFSFMDVFISFVTNGIIPVRELSAATEWFPFTWNSASFRKIYPTSSDCNNIVIILVSRRSSILCVMENGEKNEGRKGKGFRGCCSLIGWKLGIYISMGYRWLVLWEKHTGKERRKRKRCTVTSRNPARGWWTCPRRKRLKKSEIFSRYFQRHFIFHNVCPFRWTVVLYSLYGCIDRWLDDRRFFKGESSLNVCISRSCYMYFALFLTKSTLVYQVYLYSSLLV